MIVLLHKYKEWRQDVKNASLTFNWEFPSLPSQEQGSCGKARTGL